MLHNFHKTLLVFYMLIYISLCSIDLPTHAHSPLLLPNSRRLLRLHLPHPTLLFHNRHINRSRQIRQKLRHQPLINLILRVLLRRNQFREPRARLKQKQIRQRPTKRPVIVTKRLKAAPLVQDDPDGLLGDEVGVPGVGEHAAGAEAAVQLCAVPAEGHFGGRLVLLLCLLEVPLLLVGEEGREDEEHEGAREDDVGGCGFGAGEAGGEEEDIGWGCYGPEEDLGVVLGLVGWTAGEKRVEAGRTF